MSERRIIYICDGTKCGEKCTGELCSMTMDIEHAVNFIHITAEDGTEYFVEKSEGSNE